MEVRGPVTTRWADEVERLLTRIAGLERDRSNLKNAEERRTLLEFVVGQIQEPVLITTCDTDPPGPTIVYINSAFTQMTGYGPDEVLGKSPSIFQDPGTDPALVARIRRSLSDRCACMEEIADPRRNGREFCLELHILPFRSEEGDVSHFVGILRDITDRKRLERQLRQSQKMEAAGQLACGVAHDFNNILVSIIGNAELALAELAADSPARGSVEQILTAGQRAGELSAQMLAYFEGGRLAFQLVNLSRLAKEMAPLLETSNSRRTLYRYRLATQVPVIQGDPAQIRQMIMNLISNASQAIGEQSGTITVTTGAMEYDRAGLRQTYLGENRRQGTYAYIEISDTGCGMDPDANRRIFEPGFIGKFGGRGLGLATVVNIVKGHRGAIQVTSQPERGTTFRILFPATRLPAETRHRDKTCAAPLSGRPTVLVVDDEDAVRMVARRILEHHGFTVVSAADGGEAVALLRQHSNVAAVLLDLSMPSMSGEDVLRELRRVRSDLPVILCSGYSQEQVAERFAGHDVAGFVQKPFRGLALVEKVRAALQT
jgi:two-component system, cell cycle sensor histidine kinase and response regulator CckA